MKSLLQWFRNRWAGRLPLPPPVEPGEKGLFWMDRALAAVESAFGTEAAIADAYGRWQEEQERERLRREQAASVTVMFSSAKSAAMALGAFPDPADCDSKKPPEPSGWTPKTRSPADLSALLDASLDEHPFTRADHGAFVRRVREEVNRKFDGDAPAFYRAAGISRFQYSKILSHPEAVHPSKDMALRMALAFQYSLQGAEELLALAGFALSPANAADRVWSACFAHGLYHLPSVLQLLERHGG